MLRKLLSSLAIFSLLFPSIAMADDALTLGDAYDIPVLYLHHGITATQTSNITTVAPLRNKVEVTIPAMSGAIFEFSHYGYIEQVYASRVAVNTTTNVVTLTGSVVRDVCFNQAKLLISCSNGRIWDKGTELRLVDSAKRFNRFVDINTPNVLNASGALTFSGSGSFTPPTFATTAERDRQLGSSGGDIRLACVTATGACYFRLGGSWSTIGDTGTVNATTTTAGKVEILTPSNLSGGVLTDDSGAPLVLDASGIIRSSTGAINNRNKVVATNNRGYLSGSLLGSGNLNTSNFLRGDGTWASPPTANYSFAYRTATGSTKVVANTAETNFSKDVNMTGSTISSGDLWDVHFEGETKNTDGSNVANIRMKIGSTNLIVFPRLNPHDSGGCTWMGDVKLDFVTNGATAMINHSSKFYVGKNCNLISGVPSGATAASGSGSYRVDNATFNLTANPKLVLSVEHGNGTSANYSLLRSMTVHKSTAATTSQ